MLVLAPEFYRPLRALGGRVPRGHGGEGGGGADRRAAGGGRTARRARRCTRAAAGGPRRGGARGAPRDRLRERPLRLCAGSGARARRLHARAARRHDRRPGGPERRGQDDGRPPPAAVPRAGRGRDHRGRRAARAIAPEEWRRRVAWVPQRPHLFHGTVRDNLLLARPGASAAEIDEAAARARLDAVLRELPRGLGHAGGRGRRAALGRRGPAARSRPRLPEGRARAGARRADGAARPGERSRGRGRDGRSAPRADGAARRPPPDDGRPRRPRGDRRARPGGRGGPAGRAGGERVAPTRGSSPPGRTPRERALAAVSCRFSRPSAAGPPAPRRCRC